MKNFITLFSYTMPSVFTTYSGGTMLSQHQGLFLGFLSQLLFGVLYLFSYWLAPLNGTDVFALRMLTMLCGLLVILLLTVGMGSLSRFWRQNRYQGWKWWGLFLLGSLNAGSQFWLFMWAPVNGEGINVAMGYFLFPLCMALFGWLFLKARLSRLQIVALGLAALGVLHELWATQSFSWTSLWVCLVYPFYYLSRRAMGVPALQGLTIDIAFASIPGLIYLMFRTDSLMLITQDSRFWYLLPALGIVSAVAMFTNLKASQLLPIGLFSMLSYVEPILLFLLSVTVLNADVPPSAYWTYTPIWLGLVLLGINGMLKKRK